MQLVVMIKMEHKEILKQFEKIEKFIGATDLEKLKSMVGTLVMKIEELKKSRQNWKEKFFELQLENEKLKRELR